MLCFCYRGTSGIDIDLQKVDIDQCPSPPNSKVPNVFEGSDKCKEQTTKVTLTPSSITKNIRHDVKLYSTDLGCEQNESSSNISHFIWT